MSTRSGKRIHSENTGDNEISHKKIKTRRNRNKDYEDENLTEKKRKHYVKYPSDETTDHSECMRKNNKSLRKSRRNTLKERNVHITDPEETEEKHFVKHTRRTRKNDEVDVNLTKHEEINHKKDKKKSKNKKKALLLNETKLHNDQEDIAGPKKKSSKKNKKKAGSIIVTDTDSANEHCKSNGSKMSVDSFHSAAGSPKASEDDFKQLKENLTPKNKKENHDLCVKRVSPIANNSSSNKKLKSDSSIKLSTCLNFSYHKVNEDTDSVKQNDNKSEAVNMTYDKQNDYFVEDGSLADRTLMKQKSSIKIVAVDKGEECVKVPSSKKLKKSNEKKRKLSKKSFELCDMHNTNTEATHEATENLNSTFDKTDITFDKLEILDTTFETNNKTNTTFENPDKTHTTFNKNDKQQMNTTFEITEKLNTTFDKSLTLDTTFDKIEKCNKTIGKFDKTDKTNTTFDKTEKSDTTIDISEETNTTFDKTEKTDTTFDKSEETNTTFDKTEKTNTTFDKISEDDTTKSKSDNKSEAKRRHNSTINKTSEIITKNNESYSKSKSETDTTFDKISNKTSNESLISFDTSKASQISLTSDESHSEHILNDTPLLVESSMEEHNVSKSTNTPNLSALNIKLPQTPLKREGTFTKDSSEAPIMSTIPTSINKTPTRRKSLPSPGSTPFPLRKSVSKEKSVLNITHSMEKSRRSSLAEIMPRTNKVMFRSPSNNPAVISQIKGKIIKSSLKGSNKSFVFEDGDVLAAVRAAGRKRSQTQDGRGPEPPAKRSRLFGNPPPERVRSRTLSATAKIPDPGTSIKKVDTPTKPKDGRPVRTKLPNFAALHQKQFAKMESLDECQERRAKRAKQLLTPNGALAFLERISPKENQAPKPLESNQVKKSETPRKCKPAAAPPNPGYSRFGFKLNLDHNPFSFTANTADVKLKAAPKLKRQVIMPSLTGATLSRREVAKRSIMREKSFTGKRDENRKESRTVIKGVRTNRRFDLQMKMRNLNN